MNATELADELEQSALSTHRSLEIATMLRQQQEKIATWEESFYISVSENGKLRETIRQQQAEIEALKKENDHLKMVHNYKMAGFK